MKPINSTLFETEDPDILQIRKGGGCLTLFGLPFFIAGLFVLQIPFGLIPMRMEGGGPLVFYIVFPIGIAFAVVGAALAFGRNGVIIDRRRQTILKWWGLIIPFKKNRISPECL
ncbi:MAG: hypothetical protein NTX36_03195 [Proteobacteria bacterium]|nr:hypothetical protein [Pseudomonadota bacterium]